MTAALSLDVVKLHRWRFVPRPVEGSVETSTRRGLVVDAVHPLQATVHVNVGPVLLPARDVLGYQDRHLLDRAVIIAYFARDPSRRACVAASSRSDPWCEGLRF